MLTKLLIYRIRCIRIGLIALIGALCLGAVPATGAHASPQPRTGSLDVADDEVQLMQLGFQDHTLRSSTDEAKVFFTLPSTWDLQPDTKMRLHYAVKITGPMVAAQGSDTSKTSAYVASLNVRLNGKTIAFYPITQDMDSSVDITLARRETGYRLVLTRWRVSDDCRVRRQRRFPRSGSPAAAPSSARA